MSAPICQNAIRGTMEALISTSRPIIFKWLLAQECNQSITDKILLKASDSVSLSLSLPLSLSHCDMDVARRFNKSFVSLFVSPEPRCGLLRLLAPAGPPACLPACLPSCAHITVQPRLALTCVESSPTSSTHCTPPSLAPAC